MHCGLDFAQLEAGMHYYAKQHPQVALQYTEMHAAALQSDGYPQCLSSAFQAQSMSCCSLSSSCLPVPL